MIYFITENYLKKNTPVTANCDVNDILPWIKPAAETRVLPILGTYFFNQLLARYNSQTLSNDEIDLVNLIKPCIAWRAASFTVYSLSRQLKNKGLQIQNGENSEGVDLKEVSFGMDHYNQIGAQYQKMLQNWLIDNKSKFSDLMSELNTDSSIKNTFEKSNISEDFTDSIIII
jgi:hypothetical protein